jgi:hypothetical protein
MGRDAVWKVNTFSEALSTSVQFNDAHNNCLHALGCSRTMTGLLLGFTDFKKAYDSIRREVL